MAANNKANEAKKSTDSSQKNGMSEEERKRESSKAAQTALQLQREAKELIKAAAAAGDPKERQKLLNEALEKEIKAGSFGKTAKYLTSGTFQGVAAGGGIGVGSGVGLGVLTGTLVGGVTSLTLGSLGAGLGAGVGLLHGPWYKLGDVAGGAITSLTGTKNLGWNATDEQKKSLETMIGQVNEEDAPLSDELEALSKGDAYAGAPELDPDAARDQKIVQGQKGTVHGYANSYIPGMKYVPGMGGSTSTPESRPKESGKAGAQPRELAHKDTAAKEVSKRVNDNGGSKGSEQTNASHKKSENPAKENAAKARSDKNVKPPKRDHSTSDAQGQDRSLRSSTKQVNGEGPPEAGSTIAQTPKPRKKPRKLQSKSQAFEKPGNESRAQEGGDGPPPKKKPRKLESRSRRPGGVGDESQSRAADGSTIRQATKPKSSPRKLEVKSR